MSESDSQPLRGDVMDVEGVAEYLGLAASTVYDRVRSLDTPHARIGQLIRFRKVDIDRWLGENTLHPHPSLERTLADAAEKFFFENWLLSVGLDPKAYGPDEVRKRIEHSLAKFPPKALASEPRTLRVAKKTSDGKIAPEGTMEKIEISEEEARVLPPDAYTVEAAPLTTLEHFAAALGANLGLGQPIGAGLSALDAPPSRAGGARPRGPSIRPIPPSQPVKYVKHEKRTSKEFVDKVKKEQGILDFDGSLLKMAAKDLLLHFHRPNKPKEVDKNLFARNVVWHFYQEIAAGRVPDFVKEGCNIRTIFYVVKPIFTQKKIFAEIEGFYDNFTQAFQTLVEAGLISYRDFNIMDDRKPFRFLPDADFNTNILLLSEKKAFAGRFSALASKYGVMAQITDGQSTLLMTDTMLTEMAEAGFDMSKNLNILSYCDFDPVGTSIPYHFVGHLNVLGFYNVNEFTQYGDQVMKRLDEQLSRKNRPVYMEITQRRPCLDIVNPHDLDRQTVKRIRHTLTASIADNPTTADWAFITGGVTGTGRNKELVISSEQFLPYLDEHLEKKILPLLGKAPEAVGRRSNFKFLHKAIREYIGARAERDALAAANLPKR